MFKDHTLGVGLTNFAELYPTYSLMLFNVELNPEGEATNTITNTFAIYGIIYGVILIVAIWRMVQQYHKPILITLTIFAIYLFLFSTQELRFSLLFNILIMYGLMDKKKWNKNVNLNSNG